MESVVKTKRSFKSYAVNNAEDEQDLIMKKKKQNPTTFFSKAFIEKLYFQEFFCFICPPNQLSAEELLMKMYF